MTLPEPFKAIEQGLRELDAQGLRRVRRIIDSPCAALLQVDGRSLVSFASNDYLGLAAHPALAEAISVGAARYGTGSGGSHLLGGHSRAHADLEEQLAEFCGGFVDAPRALFFSTGYMANLATLSALAGRDATLFADALNHASLIDGARLSRAAIKVYPHGDVAALDAMLEASEPGLKLIVTDTVFSMDGDVAPLSALLVLAERHGAWLVVDDAHGFGVLGPAGQGAVAQLGLRSPQLIYIGTLGKAAGTAGAFVVAHATVIEWLVQRARPYIFTTAAPPALACAVSASVHLIAGDEGRQRRSHLGHLIERVRDILQRSEWLAIDSATAIQPLIIGSNRDALKIAAQLESQGLWVPAIRPPTVPPNTARLRVSLSAGHSDEDLDRLEHALLQRAGTRP